MYICFIDAYVAFLSPTIIYFLSCSFYLFITCWQFVKVQSLLGHEDWIRGVEFALEGGLDNPTYIYLKLY